MPNKFMVTYRMLHQVPVTPINKIEVATKILLILSIVLCFLLLWQLSHPAEKVRLVMPQQYYSKTGLPQHTVDGKQIQ